MSVWPNLLLVLVVGYLTMTRSFAYIGVPPLKLFIGEIVIASFLLARPRAVFDRWLYSVRLATGLTGFSIALAVFVGYGVVEAIHGVGLGYRRIIVLQSFAFNYYPICFFIGLWAARYDPLLLPRIIRGIAWVNGIYGILYILFLNRLPMVVPGTADVVMFGQPAGSAIALLGLLCFEPKLSRVWYLFILNLLVMLSLQVRAEFLGFAAGIILWGMLTRKVGRLFMGALAIALVLGIGFISDFHMPAPGTRGGQISSRDIIGRVVAPVNRDLAAQYTTSSSAKSQAGTAEWRLVWWRAIWDTVHSTTSTTFFGEGYGYPLAELVGYRERDLRTPHSVFFYALGYGGWVGVTVFFGFQLVLLHVLWRAWRRSATPFGIVYWCAFFSGALFGNAFETPFGAIPFYLLTGMAAAPMFVEVFHYARPHGAQLLSAARG